MKPLLLLAGSYAAAIRWLQSHLLTCPSRKYLHIECPGCGLQRSFIALLQGHLNESLALYPALMPILFLFVFTVLHLKFRFASGAGIIKYSYLGIAILIAVFYIYKIVNHKIIA